MDLSVDKSVVCFVGLAVCYRSVGRSVGWLGCWLVGCSAGRCVHPLVSRSVGEFCDGWLVGSTVGLWSVCQLASCLLAAARFGLVDWILV